MLKGVLIVIKLSSWVHPFHTHNPHYTYTQTRNKKSTLETILITPTLPSPLLPLLSTIHRGNITKPFKFNMSLIIIWQRWTHDNNCNIYPTSKITLTHLLTRSAFDIQNLHILTFLVIWVSFKSVCKTQTNNHLKMTIFCKI